MGFTDQRQKAKNTSDYQQNEEKVTHYWQKKKIHRQPTWSDVMGMFVFQKTELLIYFYNRKCPDLLLGSISPDLTTLNPDLVNCRISYFQITQAPGPFFSGAVGTHF